jgi:hypothetical protein
MEKREADKLEILRCLRSRVSGASYRRAYAIMPDQEVYSPTHADPAPPGKLPLSFGVALLRVVRSMPPTDEGTPNPSCLEIGPLQVIHTAHVDKAR